MNMQKRLGSEASMFEVWGNSHFHPEILSTLRQKNIDITAFVRQILRREYDFLKENGKDDENALERVVELHVNMARADILKPNREGRRLYLIIILVWIRHGITTPKSCRRVKIALYRA